MPETIAFRPWAAAAYANTALPERKPPVPDALDRMAIALRQALAPGLAAIPPESRDLCAQVRLLGPAMARLGRDELAAWASELRAALRQDGFTAGLTARAFAVTIEATRRHTGLSHHDVQILAGHQILTGKLVEMATGEGKSLTAVLPAAAAALAGAPVHVVTVNDYLAERDAEAMAPIYAQLGLSTGVVSGRTDRTNRSPVYANDIVYGTAKEIAFDYLRDRVACRHHATPSQERIGRILGGSRRAPSLAMRGLHFAIVDEADSVLIDDARTPLIISGSDANTEAFGRQCEAALAIAGSLSSGSHFRLLASHRRAELREEGLRAVDAHAVAPKLPRARKARRELVQEALSALHLYERDVHYIVEDGQVRIVDESTGRVLGDRKWERGLHQMIELKEGCPLSDRNVTLAQITFQQFFRRYVWFGGMSGTLREVSREIAAVYGPRSVRIPTHRPVRRRVLGTRLLPDGEAKWKAVVAAAGRTAAEGRPVLVGTRSVSASEALKRSFDAAGLPCVVLNARHDAREAAIVAGAGEPGRITVATNMAGRGTDIKLTPEARAAGGLHVILTEFHESGRIDRQLFGRAGRQGDPGTCEAIVCLDDLLFGLHAPLLVKAARSGRLAEGPPSTWMARILRRAAQAHAEWSDRSSRRATMRAAEALERSLAFALPSE